MKITIKDLKLNGKKVLLRADLNVPQDDNLNITSDKRIVATLPTMKYILEQGGSLIVCSHLGRPKAAEKKFSLAPVAKKMSELLELPVIFTEDVAGPDSIAKAKALKPGEVMLLENLRFEKGEEENSPEFAKKLASLADIYVNDAFGTAHRAHASTEGVAKLLPNAVGFLMSKEIEIITKVLENPERPFVAVLSGAKIADKIGMIDSFIDKADVILLAGGLGYNFIKAMGGNIGLSICDNSKLDYCKAAIEKAKEKRVQILTPIDVGASKDGDKNKKRKNMDSFGIPENYDGFDIGPRTVKLFKKAIKNAKTVIWNGTLGMAEVPQYAYGTNKFAKALSRVKHATTVIGGGDTAAAVIAAGYADKMTHVSTGGGATLELIEGRKLPGVEIINDKK